MTDEKTLITQAKNGDMYACNQVIKLYENLIEAKVKAKGYYYYSFDYPELIQCGRLAVYKSILAYDDTASKFSTFVNHVIDNELINYLRKLNSNKQKINSDTIPLNNQGEIEVVSDNGTTYIPCESDNKTPEKQVIDEEALNYAIKEVGLKLSDMEFDILKLQLQGLKQKEIAETLHITLKSVENAIARIRTKINI